MKKQTISILVTLLHCIYTIPVAASIWFVDVTATGNASGDSWVNAIDLATLQDSGTSPTPVSGDEVLVKAGTYSGSVTLISGVKYYGGFNGSEGSSSESNPVSNETIIDGGLLGSAIISNGNSADTLLRGFRITGGYDNSVLPSPGVGGGIALTGSSAKFVECILDANTADSWGGAALTDGGSPEFVACVFRNNGAVQTGVDGNNDPIITTPLAGGAVFVRTGAPSFTDCLFHDNTGMEGGAIAIEGGTPTVINCTIADNTASIGCGGGLHDSSGLASIKNSIIWSNSAARGGTQVYNDVGRFTTVANTNVQGGYVGSGNADADPVFEVATGGYRLQSTSPCRDTGDGAALPADVADLDWDANTTTLPLDLDMLARITSTSVDLGSYEFRECSINADCNGGDICCTGMCKGCCDDTDCDDGLYCNGDETCVSETCVAGSWPCTGSVTCIESTDNCGCVNDGECADALFCNGDETCVSGLCTAGSDPCPGQQCDGPGQTCVDCLDDNDCQGSQRCCSGNCQECCNNAQCPGFLNICCPSQGYVCSTTCPQ